MYPSYDAAVAHDALVRAALRSVAADHYGDEASPHADADATVASEKLALAARALVRAVDALPEVDQPIGWPAQAAEADALARVRAALARVQRLYMYPPDDLVGKGWRSGMAEAINEMTAALKEGGD